MSKRITFEKVVKLLGAFKHTEYAVSKNNHDKARNQIIIVFENGKLLQSYETIVAVYVGNQLYLSIEHDCTSTTNRFVKQFTNLSKSQRNKGLENGSIIQFV